MPVSEIASGWVGLHGLCVDRTLKKDESQEKHTFTMLLRGEKEKRTQKWKCGC